MSEQPEATVLIIHDAWHTPVHYSSFIDQLSSHCQVACPQLLSCNSESNNTSGFHDDCALIYQLCFDLACEGRDIVVFMHGYGGFIGTEILCDLGKRQREAFGQTGGIVNLVYFASWLPTETETNIKKSIWGEEWPVFIEEQVRDFFLHRRQIPTNMYRTITHWSSINLTTSCSMISVLWNRCTGPIT